MPIYDYYCKECNHHFEVFKKMDEPNPSQCPSCSLVGKIIRDYSTITTSIDSNEPKTIGELADRNTERMVEEGKLDKKSLDYESMKKKRKKKFDHKKEVTSMTPAQQEKYIMTGEK
jgi:putative FmdB family regulatory protein